MILLSTLFYVAHLIVLPLLMVGCIRTMKARLNNRQGPSPLQAFWDFAKLLRKGETSSGTATWVYHGAPIAGIASVFTVALMVPWLGVPSPIPGDLFQAVYLLALGRFAMGLGALDTGSSFGAVGASREAAISVQAEPALLAGLAVLAVRAHSSAFASFLHPSGDPGPYGAMVVALVAVTVWVTAMADLARMPIDDPATHLELTMVHEAQILEYSGRSLALIEVGYAMKVVVLIGLVSQVALMELPRLGPPLAYALSLTLIGVGAVVIALSESILVRLGWRRVPNMLSFAVGATLLACLIAAIGGY